MCRVGPGSVLGHFQLEMGRVLMVLGPLALSFVG